MDDLLTSDFKTTPYWWEGVPRPSLPITSLPASVDVAIVGSGYTGLSAALQTVRAGRSTLVLDAEEAGWGCSTRNGGQISTSVKPSYEELSLRYGRDRAFAIVKEGQNSLAWVADFIETEKIACGFGTVGRFHAAHSAKQYEALARRLKAQPDGLEVAAHMVPRGEQRRELGTDAYFGGVLYEQHAALDPARFHSGMLERALAAGVQVISHCAARKIRRDGASFSIDTARGTTNARSVVVATNGYTGALTPYLRRRVIPIGSYIIATEALGRDTMDRLIPRNRIVSDTRKVVYYYRASPDRRRILFGGRVSLSETDPKITAPRLHTELVRIFPELGGVKVSHSWFGFVAYTFDQLAHIGEHDGIFYALGYCGSGVGMATYLGMRIGQQVLGRKEGKTAFDGLKFETRPFYHGHPWFLAPSIMYYRWRDRRAW
jgi:glycine/D-amino acid oxidase-like deaminating enzyme